MSAIPSVDDLRKPSILRSAVDSIANQIVDVQTAVNILEKLLEWSTLTDKIYDIKETGLLIIPGLVSIIKINAKLINESQFNAQATLTGLKILLNCSKQDDITEIFGDFKPVLNTLKNQCKNHLQVLEAIETLQISLSTQNDSKIRKFILVHENDTKEISLQIGELEQLGVGWKIWEGGLVLARWIQQNKRNFTNYRCLEVGAGCGLSGLLLRHYCKDVVLSDYTQKLVENLQENIKLNPELHNTTAVLLDWIQVHKRENAPNLGKFDAIIGSEVLYLEDASKSLAHTVDTYLMPNGVVYILSMLQKFRLGFDPFVNELKSLGFTIDITLVNEEFFKDFSDENNWVLITAKRQTD